MTPGLIAAFSQYLELIHAGTDELRRQVYLSLGLSAAVMRMAHAHGITHCNAIAEPTLLRLLGRFGVVFNRIGPDVEYHGKRVPCLGTMDESLPNIQRVSPAVWDFITNKGEWVKTCRRKAGPKALFSSGIGKPCSRLIPGNAWHRLVVLLQPINHQ